MDPAIKKRYNDSILQTAMHRYGIAPGMIHLLDGFESFMYEFSRPDGEYILRIGHSLRRTPDMIHGEVDWINYLAAGGASVARAVFSVQGKLVEQVDDGQGCQFLCTAFVKAPGSSLTCQQLNERLFASYGRLIGKMHALSKRYHLPNPAWKRYEWDDHGNERAEDWLPAGNNLILEHYHVLIDHLRGLSRQREGYGMIHQDAHIGNFLVDEDYHITLFDFDDCVYGHYIYDIAMVLFYTSMWGQDPVEFTGRFMPAFMSGYLEENDLDPAWLKELPFFLKLREIDLFALIHFSFGQGDEPDDPWCARYMRGRRARIEAGVPYINFEWDSLRRYFVGW